MSPDDDSQLETFGLNANVIQSARVGKLPFVGTISGISFCASVPQMCIKMLCHLHRMIVHRTLHGVQNHIFAAFWLCIVETHLPPKPAAIATKTSSHCLVIKLLAVIVKLDTMLLLLLMSLASS